MKLLNLFLILEACHLTFNFEAEAERSGGKYLQTAGLQ